MKKEMIKGILAALVLAGTIGIAAKGATELARGSEQKPLEVDSIFARGSEQKPLKIVRGSEQKPLMV